MNDDSRGTHNTNSQIKFKTSMLKSSLCDYTDAYILVNGTITITGAGADDAAKQLDQKNQEVIFKNCASFTDYISEINNTQVDNAKDLNVAMSMYNLIVYRDNYSKTIIIQSLWQCYRDEQNGAIVNSESFKSKIKIYNVQ